MAITIGRLGYFGLGLENTQGSAVAPSVFLPFTEVSMRGHHEPIEEIAANTSRHMDRTSVGGKKWSEGDVAMNLDTVNAGYLIKMAMGREQLSTGTPNRHTFFVTASSNAPTTGTVIYGRGDTDIEQYTSTAVDELNIEVSDELATMTASMMGFFPTNVAAQTATTTSGTVLAFKDYCVRFGTDLTTASGASATPISELTLTIANNLEVIHQSCDANPRTIRTKGARVSGSYSIFFENETDKNAYYALQKRAMHIKFGGIQNEELHFRIPRFRLNEGEVETGVDDFYMINCEFVAEDWVDTGTATRLIDSLLYNGKSTVY